MISAYTKETSNNQLTLHIKKIEKKQTKPKVSRRKEILKKKKGIANRSVKIAGFLKRWKKLTNYYLHKPSIR